MERLSPEGAKAFWAAARRKTFAAGTVLAEEGAPAGSLVLVERGHLRVFKISATGREITLYRVHPADSCVITLSCVLAGTVYPAHVTAAAECEVWALPAEAFRQLFAREAAVQGLVVEHVSAVLSELMTLVGEIAFRKMDQRLAGLLLELHRGSNGPIRVSHDELARHLGTAREVVSRLLDNFREEGLIAGERRQIELVRIDGLAALRGDET